MTCNRLYNVLLFSILIFIAASSCSNNLVPKNSCLHKENSKQKALELAYEISTRDSATGNIFRDRGRSHIWEYNDFNYWTNKFQSYRCIVGYTMPPFSYHIVVDKNCSAWRIWSDSVEIINQFISAVFDKIDNETTAYHLAEFITSMNYHIISNGLQMVDNFNYTIAFYDMMMNLKPQIRTDNGLFIVKLFAYKKGNDSLGIELYHKDEPDWRKEDMMKDFLFEWEYVFDDTKLLYISEKSLLDDPYL